MRLNQIAVLLTCFNRVDITVACLKSLYDAILPENVSIDVFLVDDGSTDGTSNSVRLNFPDVNVICGTGSLYWNRGMHLAWESAIKKKEYDFYLWLNDDVTLFKTSIVDLLHVANKKHDSIIVGVMIDEQIEDKITYGGKTSEGIALIPNGKIQLCEGVFNGNLVLVPSLVKSEVGILDPIFPHAIGDIDYAMRARRNGFKTYIGPSASGFCSNNEFLPRWCLPNVPLIKRFKILYSPLGSAHPIYYFIYEFRYFGFFTAIKHFFSINLRAIFPRLWPN